jgi:phage terminase large subunit GpA-like protein
MDLYPSQMLFLSCDEKQVQRWVEERLEKAIDSCGIRKKLFDESATQGRKKSGDKTFTKKYLGGALHIGSAQSAGGQRAMTKRVLIRDEIDGAPRLLKTGEGPWMEVSYARTDGWGRRRKVMDFSTPTTYEDSAVWPEYESGDCRKFKVPCPHCGSFQVLDWGSEAAGFGMRWDISSDGELGEVWYQCKHCSEKIYDFHKTQMLEDGYWEATRKTTDDTLRSYHISTLYSPVGMKSWTELVKAYIKAQERPDGMRSFTNLYLGMPYKEEGNRPKIAKASDRVGVYKRKVVQPGTLFLTMSVDVQLGATNPAKQKKNPQRLEYEVCAHGAGYRTWSVDYGRVLGEIDDPHDGAWQDLWEMARDGLLTYRTDCGKEFNPVSILIDSGFGANTDVVYKFCERWPVAFPSKGSSWEAKMKEGQDPLKTNAWRRYMPRRIGTDTTLYEVSTNFYKSHVYHNLKIPRVSGPLQKPGFMDFPREYRQDYFDMLTAEERRADGTYHCPAGRRNEALDLRVLNLCAGDIYLDGAVEAFQASAKERGAGKRELAGITTRWVIDLLHTRMWGAEVAR